MTPLELGEFALCSPDEAVCILVLDGEDADAAMRVLAAARDRFRAAEGGKRAGVIIGRRSATLAQLARSLAVELAPSGIRVNAVAIGPGARVEDATEAVAFLAGEDASYVTGVMLEIGAAVSPCSPATCRPAT